MAGRARIHGPPPDQTIGRLFAWGDGFYGSLDNNLNSVSRSSPIQVGSDTDWKLGTCGMFSNMVLRSGKLFTFGYNDNGQLGQGDTVGRSSPVQVGSFADWKAFSKHGGDTSEATHFGAIRDGKLFMWGANSYGQLGLGDRTGRYSPVQVGSATNWTYVTTSNRFTLGIRGGNLFAWGYNSSGQLGLGNTTNYSSPVQVGSASDWTLISCGYFGVHGIRGGMLFGWGDNSGGVIGDSSNPNSIFSKSSPIQIGSATDWIMVNHGYMHALAIRQVGSLFAWGWNANGQLGTNNSTWRSSPVQVGALTDWTIVSAGEKYSAGIRDGKLFTWGYNGYGNLGLGDVSNRLSPVQVGSAADWRSVVAGPSHAIGVRAP